MMPIEEVIYTIERTDENPLPAKVRENAVMYLELLHDLMNDSAHYIRIYFDNNRGQQ